MALYPAKVLTTDISAIGVGYLSCSAFGIEGFGRPNDRNAHLEHLWIKFVFVEIGIFALVMHQIVCPSQATLDTP